MSEIYDTIISICIRNQKEIKMIVTLFQIEVNCKIVNIFTKKPSKDKIFSKKMELFIINKLQFIP